MAHDPFAPATRRPKPTVAAETPQDAFSGPPAGLTPDPPTQPSGAQEGALVSTVDLDWNLVPIAAPVLPGGEEGESLSGVVEQAEPWNGLVRVEEPQPARSYPCRLASCGQVLASPGALGGHMAAHRKRGELD